MSTTVANRLCLWKVLIDGERWGLPDLKPSMANCCRQHPCRTTNSKSRTILLYYCIVINIFKLRYERYR